MADKYSQNGGGLEFIFFGLILVLVPFVLPIALWVALYRTRTRIALLEHALEEHKETVERLSAVVVRQRAEAQPARDAAAPVPPPAAARPTVPLTVTPPAGREQPIAPASAPPAPQPRPVPISPAATPAPPVPSPVPAASTPSAPAPPVPAAPASVPPVPAPPVRPAAPPPAPPAAAIPAAGAAPRPASSEPGTSRPAVAAPPAPPRTPPVAPKPPAPPPPPPPPAPAFDWENLVGVKLFSAIAGVALVFAAVLFLRYSVQQGWLQPPIRVLIGIAVGVGLLVVCERKAARNYPVTANALDAAAIAILFATFFAAHALWDLIPSLVTFGLLAAVTALAVLLSIRRESLFIAVLGLLGGFATPALLSTGENRPIPLFAYLMLLNVGLAWVAYRQVWPVLTALTLALTTIYQWVWVFKFLNASDLSLGMSIFAIFPVLSVAALLLGRRGQVRPRGAEEDAFERTTILSAALPLVFVTYLATVPAYGARPGLLFGFLLLIDAGLLAVAIALRRAVLHTVGALATLLVWAVWLGTSYDDTARQLAIGFVAVFVLLYLFAPTIAGRCARPFSGSGANSVYAAPALLFVFAVIAGIDPGAEPPIPLFAPLLVLVLTCAWRAMALDRGGVFFTASFLGVATQAVWSAAHLTVDWLWPAVAVYAVFGVVSAAVPVIARRRGRPLQPQAGGAIVLLASLALLLFLSAGPIAPVALWALALLLAILNAGLFVESASSRVPVLAQVGSVLSWLILAVWWLDTAGAVGVLASLAVLTGLSLLTFAGHAWAYHSADPSAPAGAAAVRAGFARGLYIGLLGHLFILFLALNREWSLPPWPLFATLAVITLAASVTSLSIRAPLLHVLGVGAAAAVLAAWTATAAVMPWTLIGLASAAVLALYALAWIPLGDRVGAGNLTRAGAAVALFGGELTAVLAARGLEAPPFTAILLSHLFDVIVLLALTWQARWRHVASGAVAAAWIAVLQWQMSHDLTVEWQELLVLSASLYAVFTIYALIVGPRNPRVREPWLVALAAAAMTFFAARDAFDAGGLGWMIGVLPVAQGLVTAVLLRSLLRLERAGERDMTRLALVAGVALAFITVAIPLQLDHQWITIGWALEGAALAWLYLRVPHRGVFAAGAALLAVVFVRLALNPGIWTYEPRGTLRIFNWYLYTYLVAAFAMFVSARFLARTEDRIVPGLPRVSHLLPGAAVILLFMLLNIEIADYYATGPEITFRFGVTLSQDLTYTIGWLAFGMLLLVAGIYVRNRPARVTAVALIAVTTFKCFLYDLRTLEGLYRIVSFVGLAVALALVSLMLQKYVLPKPKGTA